MRTIVDDYVERSMTEGRTQMLFLGRIGDRNVDVWSEV